MPASRTEARLRAAMSAARARGDLEAWLVAAESLQAFGESRAPDSASRAQLRQELVNACDELRTQRLSRLGRLGAAGTADEVVGPLLLDVLDDAVPDPTPGGGASAMSGRALEIFDLVESASARVLLDSLSGLEGHDPGAATAQGAVRARVLELEHHITSFEPEVSGGTVEREMRLVSALTLGGTPEERSARAALLDELEEIYAATPGVGFSGGAAPARLAQVQRRLDPDELLVEYVIPHHRTHPAVKLAAVLITKSHAELVELPMLPPDAAGGFIGRMAIDGRAPIDSSPLGNFVIDARVALQRDDPTTRDRLLQLHELLVAPIQASAAAKDSRHWIVVPHRQLHPVPWMALLSPDGRWWLEDVTVTVSPSASVWCRLRDQPRVSTRAVALGNPRVGYAGLPALPQAEQEVQELAQAWAGRGWPCQSHTAAAATYERLRLAAPGAGVVHLATHGSFPEADAGSQHELLLSWAPGSAGRVGAPEVRGLDLRETWCATLSICNGGVYRLGPGNEPYGLVPAALTAGATNVVAAQWAVDDDAGRALMRLFVPALTTSGPAAALRSAAMQLAASVPIRDWAAFVNIGSGRGREPQPPPAPSQGAAPTGS